MIFVLNEELGEWETKAHFRDCEIEVSIDNQAPPADLATIGSAVISRIEANRNRIEANLVDSLFQKYNTAWAAPEEGIPILTAAEFLARMQLRSIRVGFIDDQQCISLSFDPGDLFLGHGIGIFWDSPDKMHRATLEG